MDVQERTTDVPVELSTEDRTEFRQFGHVFLGVFLVIAGAAVAVGLWVAAWQLATGVEGSVPGGSQPAPALFLATLGLIFGGLLFWKGLGVFRSAPR